MLGYIKNKFSSSVLKTYVTAKIDGFALPTILITSVIMMTVLVSVVTYNSSLSAAIIDSDFSRLAKSASDAGAVFAKSCLSANNGIAKWTDASPLGPDTDCYGTHLHQDVCLDNPIDSACVLSVNASSRVTSSFSVGYPRSEISGWKQIQSRNAHACGIAYDNRVFCWGENGYGQLGKGSSGSSLIPVAIKTDGDLSNKAIRSIAVGMFHTCVIASDGKVYCWGYGTSGQLGNGLGVSSNAPVAVDMTTSALAGKTAVAIAAGAAHTCVIASDSLVYCWGDGGYGQNGNDSLASAVIPVAVNMASGNSDLYGKTVKSISIGMDTTCVIASDDLVYCWGFNANGQIGNNTTTNQRVPKAVNMTNGVSDLYGKTVKAISAGGITNYTYFDDHYSHTCAIASDNKAYCWGYNATGELGDGTLVQKIVPKAVSASGVLNGKVLTSISSGSVHTCALATDNGTYCWGDNGYGQLGDNSKNASNVPILSQTPDSYNGSIITSIAAMGRGTCIIASSNQAYCWGRNNNGQLGDGTTTERLVPSRVKTDNVNGAKAANIVSTGKVNLIRSDGISWREYSKNSTVDIIERHWWSVSVGGQHACAIDTENQAYCWGSNANGQLGNGTVIPSLSPYPVKTTGVLAGLTIKAISAGNNHTCAIASNSKIYCWGLNDNGRLGDNSTTQRLEPVLVDTNISTKAAVAISAGYDHTCAIVADVASSLASVAYCWGNNTDGQIGDNTTAQKLVPTAVNVSASSGLYNKIVLSISSGKYSTCAIGTGSLAYCWGDNTSGQIGDNSSGTDRLIPKAVDVSASSGLNGKTVRQLSVGNANVCAIASDSNEYCWGNNGVGQLGDNTTAQKIVPTAVNKVSGVSALFGNTVYATSTGCSHTCVVASDGNIYCWGYNNGGQLGDNSTTNRIVPVQVVRNYALNGKSMVAITTGSDSSCALASDGKMYCWGLNTNGQLGNGLTANSGLPLLTYPSPYRAPIIL